MTKNEVRKLNIMYQQLLLERCGYESILGGEATLIHHWKQGRGQAVIWHFPMGIPLTAEQHNDIHLGNKAGEEYNKIIIKIKGDKWLSDMEIRKWKSIKYHITYDKVLRYFKGRAKDYI